MNGILRYIDDKGTTWEISHKGCRWFAQPQTDGIMESGIAGIMVTGFHTVLWVVIDQIDERE